MRRSGAPARRAKQRRRFGPEQVAQDDLRAAADETVSRNRNQ